MYPSLALVDPRYFYENYELPPENSEINLKLPNFESQNGIDFLLKSLPREIANWLTTFPFIPIFEENGAFSKFRTYNQQGVNIHHIVHREHIGKARRNAIRQVFDLDGLPVHPNFDQNNQNPNHLLNLILIDKDFHRNIHTIPKNKLDELKREWVKLVKCGQYSKEFSTYLYELKLAGGFVDWDSRFDWSLYFSSIFINGTRLMDKRFAHLYSDFPWEYYQEQRDYIIESYKRIKIEYKDLFIAYSKSLNKEIGRIETYH